MTFSGQLKSVKIKKSATAAFRLAAEHLFFTFIILISLAAFLGLAVFYQYGLLVQKIEPETETKSIKFKENIYQKILADWQSRGERFEAAQTKEYPAMFNVKR